MQFSKRFLSLSLAALICASSLAVERRATLPAMRPSYSQFGLRFNLLRWATLTPHVGVEFRIAPQWMAVFEGAYTSFSWKEKDRRYALWHVCPQLRFHPEGAPRFYIGAMAKVGQFNYKFSELGQQGNLVGGGMVLGYMLPLGRRAGLDFNLAFGCLQAEVEKYRLIEGIRMRQGTATHQWYGPIDAGVTFRWIFTHYRAFPK